VIRYPNDMPTPPARSLVGHLDFLPSVLDAFGLPGVPARGLSLIAEALPNGRIVPHTLHKLDDPLRWSGVTDGRYRLLLPRSGAELYDIHEDPGELNNLAARHATRVQDLIKRHQIFMRAVPELAAGEEIELPLDEETRRALEALGYLPPGSTSPPPTREAQ
jgi:arylsulfatase A-like enzyme